MAPCFSDLNPTQCDVFTVALAADGGRQTVDAHLPHIPHTLPLIISHSSSAPCCSAHHQIHISFSITVLFVFIHASAFPLHAALTSLNPLIGCLITFDPHYSPVKRPLIHFQFQACFFRAAEASAVIVPCWVGIHRRPPRPGSRVSLSSPPRLSPGGQGGEAKGARSAEHTQLGPWQTDATRGAVGVLVKEKEPAVPCAPDTGPDCTLANVLNTTQLHPQWWAVALIKRSATKAQPPENLTALPCQGQ